MMTAREFLEAQMAALEEEGTAELPVLVRLGERYYVPHEVTPGRTVEYGHVIMIFDLREKL